MPALPLNTAGPYVAAAYLVFFAIVLLYLVIMAFKLVRVERQIAELDEIVAQRARLESIGEQLIDAKTSAERQAAAAVGESA